MDTRIVLVPPIADLGRGFAVAQGLLRSAPGGQVRLVGQGATLRSVWPAWAALEERFEASELGDYVVRSQVDETRVLRESIARWLDDVLDGAVPGLRSGEAFYSAAAARLFQPVIDAASFVSGLAERHPTATFHVIDSTWVGIPLLAKAIEASGGVVDGPTRRAPSRVEWACTLMAQGVPALFATPFYPLREWLKARDGRRELANIALAQRDTPRGPPDIWFTLMGDWPRLNRPLFDSIILPELAAGTRIGVLLVGSLGRGTRQENDLKRRQGTNLWPGVAELRRSLHLCTLDQAALPGSASTLLRVLARSTMVSARTIGKLMSRSAVVDLPGLDFDLSRHASELARLVTVDVARANVAAAAARDAAQRHHLDGATIVQVSSSSADTTASDLVFQRFGARTIDVHHGSGADYWIGTPESRSTYCCRFTRADAEVVGGLRDATCLVAGMPVRIEPNHRRFATPARVLLLSNYVHRDLAQGTRYPLECFQNEVVAIAQHLHERMGEDVIVRWRPHPADNDELVTRSLARVQNLELSRRARSLEDDIAWADVILSTPSTTVIEALFANVPVFVHVPPECRIGPNARAIDPTRRVFRAEEAADRIVAAIDGLRRGNPTLTAPEEAARHALFGPSGMPEPFGDVLRNAGLLSRGPKELVERGRVSSVRAFARN